MHTIGIPLRQKKYVKIDYGEKYHSIRKEILDVIIEHGSISEIQLKIKLGIGDGMFYQRKNEVLALYKNMIEYDKSTKTYFHKKSDFPITTEWEDLK